MYKQDNILILQNRYTHIPKGKITFLYGKLYNSRQIVYKTIQNTEKKHKICINFSTRIVQTKKIRNNTNMQKYDLSITKKK